ncbi:MAG: glucosidase [Micrococcales bacterium]|nr:glucosidase [Micrococcales bacterium]
MAQRTSTQQTPEHVRLRDSPGANDPWRLWGPYVSGRQWGTVREDYSPDGNAWDFFPFDHAHARAYRWGEDGLAGVCDRYGFLNLGIAMWNRQDDRLKERLFGLTNAQGNHGEDAKEYWWHVDATPTHSYGEWLYRYPHAAYPYADLLAENGSRTREQEEYELTDTGLLADNRFFDVQVTHAKAAPDDITMVVTATNHGPEAAPLHLLPHLWFRNTWSWGRDDRKPSIRAVDAGPGRRAVETQHDFLGRYVLVADGEPEILLCDNETNSQLLFGTDEGGGRYPKDAINNAVVRMDRGGLAPEVGTKMAFHWWFDSVAPGESVTVRVRLLGEESIAGREPSALLDGTDATVAKRKSEADEFYGVVIPEGTPEEDREIARRAFAGLLWCKQLYRYDIRQWLKGDPAQINPPRERRRPQPEARNTHWRHFSIADVISMPDEWEYPWFASWDLAFHTVALAHIDPDFAKEQLVLMCREWSMHGNGQLPAYEWNFSDVNPPVHAWAVWQVYNIEGAQDQEFLIRVFTKLLLNFGWWVNRKDPDGSNLFEGGFLGMDNIGPFDRSERLPEGQRLEQSDATSWMAFFCLDMLKIAWELARNDIAWDEVATKFLEHFLDIAEAMEQFGSKNVSLWHEQDGFYYDSVVDDDGSTQPVTVRSMVGLLPLMAVAVQPEWVDEELPDFEANMAWLRGRRPELADAVVQTKQADEEVQTLSLVTRKRLGRILTRMFDEDEFLSEHGLRSLSAVYRDGYSVPIDGRNLPIRYVPAESESGMFGGNSNWRGPIWFPVNVLLTGALRTYAAGMSARTKVEFPTGSGQQLGLADIADAIEDRLIGLFRRGEDGRRPSDPRHVPTHELWQAHPTFSEYFHGDTGAGLGASHQTGWTGTVAHLICARGKARPAENHI